MPLPPHIGLILLLLAIAFPMLEIAVLIKVGAAIGFWGTLGIVVGTGLIGVSVLQQHGFVVMRRLTESLNSGRTPFLPMIEGGVMFVAGICLIAPGVITDTIGLVLLIPGVRQALATYLHDKVWGLPGRDGEEQVTRPQPEMDPGPGRPGRRPGTDGPVIDGEFERLDERPLDPRGPQGR